MRLACAQTSPVWLDKTATTLRVLEWLERAAKVDVDLLVFPEAFLSGYPFWVSRTDGARFEDARQKKAYAAYLEAAVELDGPELRRITEAVADLGVFTYLGVTERGSDSGRGTVFCTLVAIDPSRGVVSAHRKLVPTYDERLVWGWGDAHGLRVHQVGGMRVGGLSCWENWMPLARYALYAEGEELHVSVWPGSVALTSDIVRFIAREGRVFSLAAGGLLTTKDVPTDFPFYEELSALSIEQEFDGGSAIAGPDGEWLVAPVSGREELVVADVEPAMVRAERQNFDPTGHYGRPDVFEFTVDRSRRKVAHFTE